MEVVASSVGANKAVPEASLGNKSRLHKPAASIIALSQLEDRKENGIGDPGCADWCVQCEGGRVWVKRATEGSKCTAEVECSRGKSDLKPSSKTKSVLYGLAMEERLPPPEYTVSYSKVSLKPALEADFKKAGYEQAVIDANIDEQVEANWQASMPTSLGKRLVLREPETWKPLWKQLCNACHYKDMFSTKGFTPENALTDTTDDGVSEAVCLAKAG